MNNIEIPKEVKVAAQRVVAGRAAYADTTVAMAEFVLGLNKPEIVVEDFVIYKVKVRGDDEPRMGFRVAKDVFYPWVTLKSHSLNKEGAYPVSQRNTIHESEEITVIERWTPDVPENEFGIGKPNDNVTRGREVLVKGVLSADYVDPDGDVRVEINYATGMAGTHYVAAKDTAYAEEA